MDNQTIGAISAALAAERQQLLAASRLGRRDEFDRLSKSIAHTERVAISRARTQTDPDGTEKLVVRLAMRLVDGETLSAEARVYLSEALVAIAMNHLAARASLGLVRIRKRPRTTAARDEAIANYVHRSTHSVKQALSEAAPLYRATPEAARRAWEKHRARLLAGEDFTDE